MRRVCSILVSILCFGSAYAATVGTTVVVDVAPTINADCNVSEVRMVGTGANAGKYYCCTGSPKKWALCTQAGTAANPAGSNQDVQVNVGGIFGGAPGFTANPTTGAIGAASINVAGDATIAGKFKPPSGTAFPASPQSGNVFVVTDDPSLGACTSAGGAFTSQCRYNGSAWVSIGGGNTSPGGSSQSVQVNASSAFGTAPGFTADTTTGEVAAKFIKSDGSVRAYDWTGDGINDTVPAYVSALAQARAHAAMYSPDPDAYLEGGIVDAWVDVSRNHGPVARTTLSDGATTYAAVSGCGTGNATCAAATSLVCITNATAGTCSLPSSNKGLPCALGSSTCTGGACIAAFQPNDTFIVLGSNPYSWLPNTSLRSHVVIAVGDGTGGCAAGAGLALTVAPVVDPAEGLAAGMNIGKIWRDPLHMSRYGDEFLAQSVAYASRARDGKHGPDALENGSLDFSTPMQGWETTGTSALGGSGWSATDATGPWSCVEGSTGSNACVYWYGGAASDVLRTPPYPQAISVHPGERWVLSGRVVSDQPTSFTVALETDSNSDGTLEEIGATTIPDAWYKNNLQGAPGWYWTSWTIPEGVHSVRVRFRRASPNGGVLQLDGFTFRRAALYAADTVSSVTQYLLNDPGSRNIVVAGDSWVTPQNSQNHGDDFKIALGASLQTRFGRDVSSQIIVAGKAGISSGEMLTSYTCSIVNDATHAPSALGGSTNCWYDSIEQHHPLYVIVVVGTNDLYYGIAPSVFAANIQALRSRIKSIGAIPIIVGPSPVGATAAVGQGYDVPHSYYMAERNAILNTEGGPASTLSGIRVANQTSASAAPAFTLPPVSGELLVNNADQSAFSTQVSSLGSVHAYDSGVDGVPDTIQTPVSGLAQAWAHAAMQSSHPEIYLEGGIVDVWTDIARNHGPSVRSTLGDSPTSFAPVTGCGTSNATCTAATTLVCLGAVMGTCSGNSVNKGELCNPLLTTCTGGGTCVPQFQVRDTLIVVSSSPYSASATADTKTHVVTAVGDGTGGCAAGAGMAITVAPQIVPAEGLAAGMNVGRVWRDPLHFSRYADTLLGRSIAYAPAARDGKHGPDMLENGAADYTSPLAGWEFTGSSQVGQDGYSNADTAGVFGCSEGSTTTSCFYWHSGANGDVLRSPKYPNAITVHPGERWVLSGMITSEQTTSFVTALETDTNADGTLEEIGAAQPSDAWYASHVQGIPGWYWRTWTIPEGVHSVRVRFRRVSSGGGIFQIDGFSFRRANLLVDDDATAPVQYLINDPGSRNIVIAGDSWATPQDGQNHGDDIRAAFAAGLQTRFGRDISTQIFLGGKSGLTTQQLLTAHTCTVSSPPSAQGGGTNCWYDSIEKYHPLYVVLFMGTNDVELPVSVATFKANMESIRARIRSIGAIPIIVGVAPVGTTTGSGTGYDLAHSFYSAERKAILDSGFGVTPQASGVSSANQSDPTVAPVVSISGVNTGDQTTVSGNAGTASALAANGPNCNTGEASLGVNASGAAEGCWTPSTTITVADAASDATTFPLLSPDATGALAPKTDAGLSYDAASDTLSPTKVSTGEINTPNNAGSNGILIGPTVARTGTASSVLFRNGITPTGWFNTANNFVLGAGIGIFAANGSDETTYATDANVFFKAFNGTLTTDHRLAYFTADAGPTNASSVDVTALYTKAHFASGNASSTMRSLIGAEFESAVEVWGSNQSVTSITGMRAQFNNYSWGANTGTTVGTATAGWFGAPQLNQGQNTTYTTMILGKYANPPAPGTGSSVTSLYGLHVDQMTRGASNYGLWLDASGTGYKAIAIRDANVWIGSNAAGQLDINGTTVKVNGNTLSGTNTGDQTNITGNAGTVTVGDTGDSPNMYPLVSPAYSGSQQPRTDTGLVFNTYSNVLAATGGFQGPLIGTADYATAAYALTSNPAPCPAGQFVTDTAADGTLTCSNSAVSTSATQFVNGYNSTHRMEWNTDSIGGTVLTLKGDAITGTPPSPLQGLLRITPSVASMASTSKAWTFRVDDLSGNQKFWVGRTTGANALNHGIRMGFDDANYLQFSGGAAAAGVGAFSLVGLTSLTLPNPTTCANFTATTFKNQTFTSSETTGTATGVAFDTTVARSSGYTAYSFADNGTSLWFVNNVSGVYRFNLDINLRLNTLGNGILIKEGTNATLGTATLVAGTVTVGNTKVTANSRIFLTIQSLGTVTVPKAVAVTARTASTSFVITSADATDTSVVAWQIIEGL